jgi:DNA-binding PucR family transcriptional regulator
MQKAHLVLAQPEALEHVLERRGVQVLLQMVERVLRHVRHAQVGVAPHRAGAALVLAGDDLDQRLRAPKNTCSVQPNVSVQEVCRHFRQQQ